MQSPVAQCELQLALPEHCDWQLPEAQLDSQVALPLQLSEQIEPLQFCVQLLVLPQVVWQVASP